jgi:hypothetical protein
MKYGALVLLILCLCSIAQAVPNLPTVSGLSSNGAVFTATGAVTPCWFQWGMLSNGNEIWHTPNSTPATGTCTAQINGTPLNAGSVYFVMAFDSTGNSTLDATFTTLPIALNAATTYGNLYRNVTQTGFQPTFIIANTLGPYFWVSPTSFIWGFLFMIIYIGYWIRGRNVLIPAILGFCTGSMFLYSTMGLGLGIPVEFTAIAQGIAYASIAGVILGLIHK